MNSTNTKVSTKAAAAAEAITTELTLDWTGVTEEDLRALAQQALIVKLQSGWRKNGIPSETTVKVADHRPGVRAPKAKQDVLALARAMTPEQRAALLAELTATAE